MDGVGGWEKSGLASLRMMDWLRRRNKRNPSIFSAVDNLMRMIRVSVAFVSFVVRHAPRASESDGDGCSSSQRLGIYTIVLTKHPFDYVVTSSLFPRGLFNNSYPHHRRLVVPALRAKGLALLNLVVLEESA